MFEGLQAAGRRASPRRHARPGRGQRRDRPRTKLSGSRRRPIRCCKLSDIAAVARACAPARVLLAVDNTFVTPVLQRPLDLGANVVVHSTTKYLNGHCDVVGGAVIGRDRRCASGSHFLQNAVGAVPGLRQLPRAARHEDAGRAHGAPRRRTRCASPRWLESRTRGRPGDLPGAAVPSAARAGAASR